MLRKRHFIVTNNDRSLHEPRNRRVHIAQYRDALALIVMKFTAELWHVVTEFTKPTLTNTKLMLAALDLIDVTLLANLVLMVILSGYRNLVSELDGDGVQSLPP